MSSSFILVLYFAVLVAVCAIDPILKLRDTSPERQGNGEIYGVRDSDVTISCFVENLPVGSEVKFRRTYGKNPEKTEEISKNESPVDNTKFGLEKPTPSTWRLRIKRIQYTSEGIYTCYVTQNRDSEWAKSVIVRVMLPPVLIPSETSTDMIVKEGDTVELMCNALGSPTPTIQWQRQGNALLPIGQEIYIGRKLEIVDIESHHRGVYRCLASNVMDSVSRSIEVDVLFPPIVRVNEDNLRQAVGYVIELQCLIEGNPEPEDSELSWYQGAVGISRNSGRYKVNLVRGAFNRLTYELIINGVQPEDFGDYRCQAKNDLGNSYGYITLSESDVPQKSQKLGIVIKAGAPGLCASNVSVLLVTVLSLLLSRI